MKNPSYKVQFGRFTTYHKSEKAAKAKARSVKGQLFIREPWLSHPQRDHCDEMGAWLLIQLDPPQAERL